jgi:hypothetical protein
MPDKDGSLNDDDRKKIEAFVARIGDPPCPMCKHPNWSPGVRLVANPKDRFNPFFLAAFQLNYVAR